MKKAKVIFLDRDGVINEYPGHYKYVTTEGELRILPGVARSLERLCAAGYRLFVVSNQAGVAKGIYTQDMLDRITRKMLAELGTGVVFDGIYYCVHRVEEACACRKPRTGLIDRAIRQLREQGYEVDRDSSFFIGDSAIDVETGKKAGLKTILVYSGREKPSDGTAVKLAPDHTASDLAAALTRIIPP